MSSTQCTLVAGGEVIRSQHHQPSGSNWLGVYRLVSSMQLTSPTWPVAQAKNLGSILDIFISYPVTNPSVTLVG